MHVALRTRRASVSCQLSSTAVNVSLPLFVLHSLTDGAFIIVGGQHFSKACKEYRMAPRSPYVNEPLVNLRDWMRYVSATILRTNTRVQVCASATGRHQRSQENSNPSTTSTWA